MNDTEDEILAEPKRTSAADVAWVAVFLAGCLLGFGALFWITWGRFFDPGFYEAVSGGTWSITTAMVSPGIERVATAGVRLAGILGAMASVLLVAIALTSFRRGERWAWYAVVVLPVFAAFDFSFVAGYQALTVTSIVWDAALFGLATLGLALGYPRAFGETPGGTEARPTVRPSLA